MIKRVIDWLKPFYPTIKVLEVLGIITALVAFSYDFVVEKPRERAVANATMLAQMAALDESDATDRIAISLMLITLIDGDVPIDNISIPFLEFHDRTITEAQFGRSSFLRAKFQGTVFNNLQAQDTGFPEAIFNRAIFNRGEVQNAPNLLVFAEGSSTETHQYDLSAIHSLRVLSDTELMQTNGFRGVRFLQSSFYGFTFTGVNLTEAVFFDPIFNRSTIQSSLLSNTTFMGLDSSTPDDWDLTIRASLLQEADFAGVPLENMKRIKFVNCVFNNVSFPEGYELPEGAEAILQ